MKKNKIILVDDDLLLGSIMVKALQDNGYEVYYQNTLIGVEQLILKVSPNIIILDVMVGEKNSLEEINNIKLAANNIPIIFISSFTDIEFQKQATANGAVMYLEKPFTCEKLIMWVKRYAQGTNLEQANLCYLGNYSLNTQEHVLLYKGEDYKSLGNTEYETLRILLVNKDISVSRDFLKSTVWQGVVCTDENLNNVICRLRKYLNADSRINIETQRGEGFKLTFQK